MEKAKIKHFTDLRIWQSAHELAVEIYTLTKGFPKSEVYGITDQLRRATLSVGANIAEGFGRYYQKEKIRFLYTSRGSLYEVQNFILIAKDLGYLEAEKASSLIERIDHLGVSIHAFIKALRVPITKQTNT